MNGVTVEPLVLAEAEAAVRVAEHRLDWRARQAEAAAEQARRRTVRSITVEGRVLKPALFDPIRMLSAAIKSTGLNITSLRRVARTVTGPDPARTYIDTRPPPGHDSRTLAPQAVASGRGMTAAVVTTVPAAVRVGFAPGRRVRRPPRTT